MIAAIEEIDEYLDGRDFGAYLITPLVQRAIERCVEIISEASRFIPEDIKQMHAGVPWAEIRAIGNVVRHDYGHVDNAVIWRIAQKFAPELKRTLLAILDGLDEELD